MDAPAIRRADVVSWIAALLLVGASAVVLIGARNSRGSVEDARRAESASLANRDLSQLRIISHADDLTGPADTALVGNGRGAAVRLLYLFRTDCEVCSAQRIRIADAFAKLRAPTVTTASAQDAGLTASYWSGTMLDGLRPSGVDVDDLKRYELRYVPTLLSVDSAGRVLEAHVGAMTTEELSAFVARQGLAQRE